MAMDFCSGCPLKSRLKEWFAPNSRAISGVLSTEPESTMMISSAQRTLARVRGRFFSSLVAIMATERVGFTDTAEALILLLCAGRPRVFAAVLWSGRGPLQIGQT